MEIIHLSTGHLGGAGLAARRLSAGLRWAGIDSKFIALRNATFTTQDNELEIGRNLIERAECGITTYVSKKFSDQSLVTPISKNLISRDLLRKISANESTIFHIHNWFNIFSQSALAELSRDFNFVLTLHDQRTFTAACHYSLGCEQFRTTCKKCPQLPSIFQNLPNYLSMEHDFSKINFVSPSKWLLDLAQSSNFLAGSTGHLIPNSFFGYNTTVEDRRSSKAKINVGFGAMDSNSWIKGGDVVSGLRKKHSVGGSFEFFALSNFKDYKDFWRSIDVLLVPSRADNSPNVIHEAKLWGIPVVSTNVGGIPEILQENFDSFIQIENLSIETIESEIIRVFEFSKNIELRQKVVSDHKKFLDSSLEKHTNLYETLSKKNRF